MELGKEIFRRTTNTVKKTIMSTEKENEKDTSQVDRTKEADSVIRNHVVWAMGASFIPVVVADVLAISALQLDMIRQMCRVYDVDFSETQGKAIVTSLTSTTLARMTAARLVKIIPGVGSVVGGVTMSALTGASTYALGEVFKKHFETGGTILDFDTDRLKKLYKEKFEKGKKIAQEWRKQEEEASKQTEVVDSTSSSAPSTEVLARLKELGQLKEQGVISEEEFAQMKKKLIDQF